MGANWIISPVHDPVTGVFNDEIYYHLEGPPNASAVVLTHGVGMDHCTFKEQLAVLKKDHRVLVWDLPGHGASNISRYQGRYTIMAADRLHELMTGLGIREAVHVGQSLGSLIVQRLLQRHPESVVATVHAPGVELTSQLGGGIRMMIPLFMRMLRRMPEDKFCESFAAQRAESAAVRKYMVRTMRRTGKELALRITRDMIDELKELHPKPPHRPMLIVCGNKDLDFIQARSRKWHARTPGSRYEAILGASHIVNQDQPAQFNMLLLDLLKQVREMKPEQRLSDGMEVG